MFLASPPPAHPKEGGWEALAVCSPGRHDAWHVMQTFYMFVTSAAEGARALHFASFSNLPALLCQPWPCLSSEPLSCLSCSKSFWVETVWQLQVSKRTVCWRSGFHVGVAESMLISTVGTGKCSDPGFAAWGGGRNMEPEVSWTLSEPQFCLWSAWVAWDDYIIPRELLFFSRWMLSLRSEDYGKD